MGKNVLGRKKRNNWVDQYSKERKRYYNKNGWGILNSRK